MLDFLLFLLGNYNFTREQLTLHRSDVSEEMNTAHFETVQFTVFRGSSKIQTSRGPEIWTFYDWGDPLEIGDGATSKGQASNYNGVAPAQRELGKYWWAQDKTHE